MSHKVLESLSTHLYNGGKYIITVLGELSKILHIKCLAYDICTKYILTIIITNVVLNI